MAKKGERPAIGNDLGTTYSCVGVWQHDRVEIITNDQGNHTTPTYVAFTDTERLIDDAAKNQVAMNSINIVFNAKRLIGRRFSDAPVKGDMKLWPFKVIPEPDDKPRIVVSYNNEDKQFAAEEISSMVLIKMREIAEAFLGSTVKNVVVIGPCRTKSLFRVYMYDLPRRFNVGVLDHQTSDETSVTARSLPAWLRKSGLTMRHNMEYWMMVSSLCEGKDPTREAIRVLDPNSTAEFKDWAFGRA